jgi:dCTP deaminase
MTVLNDKQIIELCRTPWQMIDPCVDEQVRAVDGKRVISYGVSSYGYDARLAE